MHFSLYSHLPYTASLIRWNTFKSLNRKPLGKNASDSQSQVLLPHIKALFAYQGLIYIYIDTKSVPRFFLYLFSTFFHSLRTPLQPFEAALLYPLPLFFTPHPLVRPLFSLILSLLISVLVSKCGIQQGFYTVLADSNSARGGVQLTGVEAARDGGLMGREGGSRRREWGNDAQIGRIISKTTTPSFWSPSLISLLSLAIRDFLSLTNGDERELLSVSPILTLCHDVQLLGVEYNPHCHHDCHRRRHHSHRVTESSDYYLICRHGLHAPYG